MNREGRRLTRKLPLPSGSAARFFFSRFMLLVSVSAALVVALGFFATNSLATLNEGTEWVEHAQRVRYELSHVLQLLVDLGSGVRRYEMTHDPQSFQEADAAAAALPIELAGLHRILADDPGLAALEPELIAAAHEREKQARHMIDMSRVGDAAGIRAIIESGDNVQVLDLCRAVVARMQDLENSMFQKHARQSAAARDTVAFAIIATTVLAVALLMLVAFFSVRHSARLQQVQNDLTTTLRSIGDAVISTGATGAVRFMNPVAEQLTGWTNYEAQDVPLDDIFRIVNEQSREPVESPVSRVLRERRIVGLANHTVLIARDGQERPIEDSGAPIENLDGALTGVVLVFRDATAQREAQRVLLESTAALREADRRKDIFLATLSHELRNPLAPIRNAARLLEAADPSTAEVKRSREIIARQVRHMASLLDDLLDISRITRGMLTLKQETVGLLSLFEAAVEAVRPAIDAKHQQLQVEWPAESLRIEADPVRLTQVVTNLLMNASKYTDPKGYITLGTHLEGSGLVIFVKDTGIGIASDMLTQVFEMFSQVLPDKSHADGGLGIGLALVKGLIELHGGHVEARSAGLEQGSEFVVHFPNALRAVPPLMLVAAAIPASPPRPLRVLIADDNRDSAESLGMLLEISGHEIFLAHDGLEAVKVATDKRPDVALLDIGMPGMDGYDVAAALRRESWGAGMTLIAITGWGQEEAKRSARAAGFDHHLTKPMDTQVLETLLAAVLGEAHERA